MPRESTHCNYFLQSTCIAAFVCARFGYLSKGGAVHQNMVMLNRGFTQETMTYLARMRSANSGSWIISPPSWFPNVIHLRSCFKISYTCSPSSKQVKTYPGRVLCLLPKISTFLPPGHILSMIPYTSSGFRDVSRTSDTMTSVSRPRLIHDGQLIPAGSEASVESSVLIPTSICSFV